MKVGFVVYTEYEMNRNEFFIEKLLTTAYKFSIKLIPVIFEKIKISSERNNRIICYDGRIIDYPDFVIMRMMNYNLAKMFENMGIKVFNSSEISKIADNKYLTYLKMKEIGVPVMDTFLNTDISEGNLFYPNVTKPIDSKGGDRVFLNHNLSEYKKNIESYKNTNFIIQKVASDIGKDLRVYVIGQEIVTSILRTSNDGFLSNFCRGGNATIYKLNRKEINIVRHIMKYIKFDYAGIDFVFDDGKIILNEIENVVGARMVYSKTNINIAEKLMKYIDSTIKFKLNFK